MMKVFLSTGDVTVEFKVKSPYSPDVLEDMCHRANELLIQQRAAASLLSVAGEDAEELE
jgi:hypothetical protein